MFWFASDVGFLSDYETLSVAFLLSVAFFCWVDGLSGPRQEQNRKLKKLIRDYDEDDDSSAQLADLKTKHASITEKYEQELLGERTKNDELQQRITNLLAELKSEEEKRHEVSELKFGEQADEHAIDSTECSEKYRIVKRNMGSRIEEQPEDRIKRHVDSEAEVKSLTAVLEMKTEKIQQLQNQLVSHSLLRDEIDVLSHKCEQLEQKNEDLAMQLQDRTVENRNLSEKCQKLQGYFSEEQSRSARLRQYNEELEYRLDSVSPLLPSFNPVFTTSPVSHEEASNS